MFYNTRMPMRVWLFVIVTCIGGAFFGVAMAQSWKLYKDAVPQDVLDDIVQNDDSQIIETELDKTYNTQVYWPEYKLSGTIESVRQNIDIYLQRFAFIGLSASVFLIIYNGLLLVMSPLTEDQTAKVKTRMIYITLGALLITWFYFLLKILLAVLVDVLVK